MNETGGMVYGTYGRKAKHTGSWWRNLKGTNWKI